MVQRSWFISMWTRYGTRLSCHWWNVTHCAASIIYNISIWLVKKLSEDYGLFLAYMYQNREIMLSNDAKYQVFCAEPEERLTAYNANNTFEIKYSCFGTLCCKKEVYLYSLTSILIRMVNYWRIHTITVVVTKLPELNPWLSPHTGSQSYYWFLYRS